MRLTCVCLLAGLVGVLNETIAASSDERVEALFRPPLDERISLSPNGQRLAYALPRGRSVSIVMMNLEHPVPKRTVRLETADERAPGEEDPAVGLRFLRWATTTRLVFARTERIVTLPPVAVGKGQVRPNPSGPTIISPIETVDVDGKERATLVDARDFMDTPEEARKTLADLLRTPQELASNHAEPASWRMPHLDIVGFLPSDREQLIIRTRGSYSLPSQHLVDIRTGSVREYDGDWLPPAGANEVVDGFRQEVVGDRLAGPHAITRWRDQELAGVQRELEAKFPSRTVELLDWSAKRERVLFRVTGGEDPGRIFVFQRAEDLVLEVLRRMPWLDAATLGRTQFFEFPASDGGHVGCHVTSPPAAGEGRRPVVLVFPAEISDASLPAFDPETQVLVDRGFAVVRLHHRRGADGKPDAVAALRRAVERLSIADAGAMVDRLAADVPELRLDAARVVTFGRGFGGYLALRALQQEPGRFRGGIAFDAPLELHSWRRAPVALHGDLQADSAVSAPMKLGVPEGIDGREWSVVEQADALMPPVLLLAEPTRSPAIDAAYVDLRARLERLGRPAEYVALDAGFAAGRLVSRVSVYQKVGDFLEQQVTRGGGETSRRGQGEP